MSVTPSEQAQVISSLTLQIPASTSNLGPGFDALALALNMYSTVRFEVYDRPEVTQPIVTLHGSIAAVSDKENQGLLCYRMLQGLWQSDPELLSRVRISVTSDIPLGCGLGSSGAAIAGAVWASYFLRGLVPTRKDILTVGTRMEGYPENVAASLMGNMIVCGKGLDDETIVSEQLDWPDKWKVLVVVPRYTLKTNDSRKVLPKMVKYEDAVANIQRTALIVAAVAKNDEALMRSVLVDRLHEPYREQLVLELATLRKLLSSFPIMGCVLSGGGSAVLTLVNQRYKDEVLHELKMWAEAQPMMPTLLDLSVDKEGMREV